MMADYQPWSRLYLATKHGETDTEREREEPNGPRGCSRLWACPCLLRGSEVRLV